MKFEIHNGDDDYIVIEGETIDEIRNRAEIETKKREWKDENLWSMAVEGEG